MGSTVLALIQKHCRAHALNVPTSIISSTDTTVNQLLQILENQAQEIVTESKFNVTTLECTFTTIAAIDQGAIAALGGGLSGFQWMYNETFYDRTLMRPLFGPLNETQWQQIMALPDPGPFYKYRLRGDNLLLAPAPSGIMSDIAFEYASSFCVKSMAGTAQDSIAADTDTYVFPDQIMLRALAWRWKETKGLAYQADEAAYYNLLNNYVARNKTAARIDVANPVNRDMLPGIFVPSGNWPV